MREFEKVSFAQFEKDFIEAFPSLLDDDLTPRQHYDLIKLPQHATPKSVGYDFFSYFGFQLMPGEDIKFPTGIKVKLDDDVVLPVLINGECVNIPCNEWLGFYPRSGQGFKYLRVANTVGVIDGDYYNNSDNEGEIFVKLRNESNNKLFTFKAGDAFGQGIIQLAMLTSNDPGSYKECRVGGLGSTSK
ncbi:MAG: hypothetical protein KME47_10135 [Nodosilinea sp. WJT8-NPBG4]|jgi:dUTP pyrophosphatase|nr:hypothetical protein [Nodosilinea sp. WJT8-NPBG4]